MTNGDADKYESLLNSPAFDNMEPERKESFVQLSKKLEGKSNMEALVIISEFVKNMPKGREITREEQNAMIGALLETMPEKDRARFQTILNML